MREGREGGRADEQAHSLSLANACNPYYERIPLAQDNTSRVFPPCVPSRANPSGLGHAATILLVGPGTPGVETLTGMAKVLIPCLLYHVRACSLLKYLGQEDLGALVFPSPSIVLMSTTIITVRATTYLLPPMSAMLGVHTIVEQGSTMYESSFRMQKNCLPKHFFPHL
jgi:hypothetical protein